MHSCTHVYALEFTEKKEVSLYDHNGAFSSLRKITRFIFPSQAQIKVIGGSMFYGCESLNEIIIPESVEEIDEDAFANCHSLTEIASPKSVKKIHGDAFRDCTNLKRVIADTEAMWEVKKYIGTSVQIDSLYTNTAEQFAKSLSSNTIATTYFGSAYTKFVWYLV